MPESPDISFVNEKMIAIRDLKGISKTAASSSSKAPIAQKYLNELAQAQLDEDLDHQFGRLKSTFRFKRKELTAQGPADGIGALTTPHFVYEVSIHPIEEQLRNVMLRRCVRSIADADTITGEEFHAVFESLFNQLEVRCATQMDIESIIDQIEDADVEDVELDYDRDITWCTIEMAAMRTEIEVHPNLIRVKGPLDVTPAELIQSFFEMQNFFMDALNLKEPLLRGSKI